MSGLVARLRAPLEQPADFTDVLTEGWQSASAADLAARPVYLNGAAVPLGSLFDVGGDSDGTIRFIGDLRQADRIGAGLRGGEVVIEGNVGRETGARMRRGLIAVAGDAGARTGLNVIAGTIVVGGATGDEAGLWSKRGSVIALGAVTPPPTYQYACTYRPLHVRLMLTRLLRRFSLSLTPHHIDGSYDRYSGDFAELGKGEILAWQQT